MGIEIKKLEIRPLFVLALLIVCIFLLYMYLRPGKGSIKVNVGDYGIIIDISNNQVSILDLLNKLLEGNKYQKEIMAILEQKYGLYKKDSSQLIDIIRIEEPNSKLSKNLRGLLYDLKGPFERQSHDFYNIKDVKVVDAINNLDFYHPVAEKFRELRDNSSGIFFNKAIKVKIRICNSEMISDDFAAVCKGSKFYKKSIMLRHPDDHTKIDTVFADKEIPCNEEDEVQTLILINPYNGCKLYDNITVGEYLSAFLWTSEEGYDFKPNEDNLVAVR